MPKTLSIKHLKSIEIKVIHFCSWFMNWLTGKQNMIQIKNQIPTDSAWVEQKILFFDRLPVFWDGIRIHSFFFISLLFFFLSFLTPPQLKCCSLTCRYACTTQGDKPKSSDVESPKVRLGSHLSNGPSDLKQNGTQEKTPFSSTVFNTPSHDVICFVASVS